MCHWDKVHACSGKSEAIQTCLLWESPGMRLITPGPAACSLTQARTLLQVESLLDEATAELGKMEFSPMLSTIEADFKIRKSVPLHTTLKIECEVCTLPHYKSPSGILSSAGTMNSK